MSLEDFFEVLHEQKVITKDAEHHSFFAYVYRW